MGAAGRTFIKLAKSSEQVEPGRAGGGLAVVYRALLVLHLLLFDRNQFIDYRRCFILTLKFVKRSRREVGSDNHKDCTVDFLLNIRKKKLAFSMQTIDQFD